MRGSGEIAVVDGDTGGREMGEKRKENEGERNIRIN